MTAPLAAFLLAVAATLTGSAVVDKREHIVFRWIALFSTLVILGIMIAIVISF